MSSLNSELSPQVLAACQTGAAEAADAFGRCFDDKFELTPGEVVNLNAQDLPADWNGPGLVLVLTVDDNAAAVVIPEATSFLPAWYSTPDATGVSKLATLSQELGMLLLPEAQMPMDFTAGHVTHLGEALVRGGLSDAAAIPISIKTGNNTSTAHLLWPLLYPKEVLAKPKAAEAAKPAPVAAAAAPPAGAGNAPQRVRELEEALPTLPPYIRSLLRIKVALSVTLAQTQQPVNRILELGPGSIIQFDKSCESPLTLFVGTSEVAVGEAVKIGEKFGLRITSMVMPDERFLPLQAKKRAG